jgi:tetratricopeptide (TPR) repeat protein
MAHIWMHFAGYAKNHLGVYERAVDWLRRAIEANRNYSLAFFQLAAAFAQLGRLDEARSAVGTGLDLDPAFSLSRARAGWTAISDDPIYLTELELNLASMRMPECPNNDRDPSPRGDHSHRRHRLFAPHGRGRGGDGLGGARTRRDGGSMNY